VAREIVLEDQIVAYAEACGWLVRKMIYPGRRGCPDRWFFKHGAIVIMEIKRAGRPAQPDGNQVREHRRLRDHGFRVHLVNDFETARALLDAAA